ncbi:MAG: SRPBCC domain-containing protein [Candidatus Dormibacteria bacterium]
MTSTDPGRPVILGVLAVADGRGMVRLRERLAAPIREVWSAITDPSRLAAWHARVEGDLRLGGEFRIFVEADDWEGTGRVTACAPPRRLAVTSRESEESWRRGRGAAPFDESLEVRLEPDGEGSAITVAVSGLPLEPLAAYGAGWQIHLENLISHLAGRARGDTEARWEALIPAYEAQAAGLR